MQIQPKDAPPPPPPAKGGPPTDEMPQNQIAGEITAIPGVWQVGASWNPHDAVWLVSVIYQECAEPFEAEHASLYQALKEVKDAIRAAQSDSVRSAFSLVSGYLGELDDPEVNRALAVLWQAVKRQDD